jgi:hypothetical protein
VAAGRQPRQHPLHHHLAEQVIVGERRVGLQLHLAAVQRARPRPPDGYATAPEHHRAAGAGVPAGAAVGDLGVLGADLRGDLGLHQLGHDTQPHRHTHRQQPLAGRAGDVGQRDAHLIGQLQQISNVLGRDGAQIRYGVHGGPLPSRATWRLPDTYHTAGLRPGIATSLQQQPRQPQFPTTVRSGVGAGGRRCGRLWLPAGLLVDVCGLRLLVLGARRRV